MNVENMILLLRARYDEPWRHYHDWPHVERMFQELAAVRHLVHDSTAVEWAIRFHDSVYEPTAANNEERSAQLARAWLRPFLPVATVSEVARLVLLTKRHEPSSQDTDGQIICDCDLAVLGWPWGDFEEFGRRIREEYIFVDDQTFRAHRRQFMRTFLSRPHIFSLEHFWQKYEAQARNNIEHTIALLS